MIRVFHNIAPHSLQTSKFVLYRPHSGSTCFFMLLDSANGATLTVQCAALTLPFKFTHEFWDDGIRFSSTIPAVMLKKIGTIYTGER